MRHIAVFFVLCRFESTIKPVMSCQMTMTFTVQLHLEREFTQIQQTDESSLLRHLT